MTNEMTIDPTAPQPVERVLVVDSITQLTATHRGQVVVAASHGGSYAGYCAARGGVSAVIFNDAGIGKDEAGIASLAMLEPVGMPVAVASNLSCEIGNGDDMIRNGVISHVNAIAMQLGCKAGQSVKHCANLMLATTPPSGSIPASAEARRILRDEPGKPRIITIDSASLLHEEDEGAIVITGSHGALLGGRPDNVVSMDALALVYHDAGLGKNEAGATRLAALDLRGIAAVTAAAETARIGDARSVYEEGVISRANATAGALGATPGKTVREFVELASRAGSRPQ